MQAGSYKRERICMQEGVQSVKCLAIFKDRSAKIIVGILYQPDCTDSEEKPRVWWRNIYFHWFSLVRQMGKLSTTGCQIHSLNPPRHDKQLGCAKRTGRNLTEQNPLTMRCAPQNAEGMPWYCSWLVACLRNQHHTWAPDKFSWVKVQAEPPAPFINPISIPNESIQGAESPTVAAFRVKYPFDVSKSTGSAYLSAVFRG